MTRHIKQIARLKRSGDILCVKIVERHCNVDKHEAEILYDSGKEPTVAKLLEYDAES